MAHFPLRSTCLLKCSEDFILGQREAVNVDVLVGRLSGVDEGGGDGARHLGDVGRFVGLVSGVIDRGGVDVWVEGHDAELEGLLWFD